MGKELEKLARWNKSWIAMVLLVAMLGLSACGGGSTVSDNNPAVGESSQNNTQSSGNSDSNANSTNNSTEEAPQAAYPLTLTDATGTEVTFDKAPERIISLVPSETENLFAVGAGEQVVGVDEWSNYPEEATAKPKVGDMNTNVEAVLALNPDLVITSASMTKEVIDQLRELNITVFSSNPTTLDETITHMEQLGLITGHAEEASKVAEEMRQAKEQVVNTVKDAPKKKVYLEYYAGYSAGQGTFLDELMTLAGGENVAGDEQGWFEIDPEKVLESNPDVIVYPNMGDDKSLLEGITSRPGWENVEAVKNDRLIAVTEDPLVRPGPRLTEGLLELAKAIHPDLFK
ncbi:ABC transporter substrate-binding protein [Paenibacillaceae bacterium]|nr:ABC transporter substrate-binding protein [Paenibacillaceae bacterium]